MNDKIFVITQTDDPSGPDSTTYPVAVFTNYDDCEPYIEALRSTWRAGPAFPVYEVEELPLNPRIGGGA